MMQVTPEGVQVQKRVLWHRADRASRWAVLATADTIGELLETMSDGPAGEFITLTNGETPNQQRRRVR